ncbi:hypothetical protein AB0L99_42965 [Streptomyces sp. NPDC051954]|uniref:hypothetical protein n=1 Tax=Streptomyces sp. NPDC051954 TaxID=3155524 RepID=UPI00343F9193
MGMGIMANTPRVSRKGMLAIVAVFGILLSVFSMTAPTVRATEAKSAGHAADVGAMAWSPGVSPLYTAKESALPHLTTDERNRIINNCQTGFLCVAAGEGNGLHTVFKLYYCGERTLSNFLGYGAIVNNQPGVSQVGLAGQDKKYTYYDVDIRGMRVYWDPIWYLDPC